MTGFLAFELAKYFNTVWATDSHPSNIASAVQYLSEHPHAHNKIFFSVRKPEDGVPAPAQNLDAIAIGNSIHTTSDPTKVVATAGDMLKSGGTIAMWVAGLRFFFVDEGKSKAQGVFDEAFRQWMVSSFGKTADKKAQILASRLDSIAFPGNTWENVRRIHWNRDRSMVGEPDSRIPTLPNKIGEGDNVDSRAEKEFMTVEADLDWVVNYMNTLNPKVAFEEVCGEQCVELEKCLGGRHEKFRVGWPLTLVLATKR